MPPAETTGEGSRPTSPSLLGNRNLVWLDFSSKHQQRDSSCLLTAVHAAGGWRAVGCWEGAGDPGARRSPAGPLRSQVRVQHPQVVVPRREGPSRAQHSARQFLEHRGGWETGVLSWPLFLWFFGRHRKPSPVWGAGHVLLWHGAETAEVPLCHVKLDGASAEAGKLLFQL